MYIHPWSLCTKPVWTVATRPLLLCVPSDRPTEGTYPALLVLAPSYRCNTYVHLNTDTILFFGGGREHEPNPGHDDPYQSNNPPLWRRRTSSAQSI